MHLFHHEASATDNNDAHYDPEHFRFLFLKIGFDVWYETVDIIYLTSGFIETIFATPYQNITMMIASIEKLEKSTFPHENNFFIYNSIKIKLLIHSKNSSELLLISRFNEISA